ncbi:hypothetical protein CRG98_004280 [Punica granatum]|uniref:Uncharacterized protein n=1 Tax=Punica granatum TaxID=22663 RepID=A0A2I0L3W5_PUNGR|nr:hypothetical protein CRG98_004280 [Punica granatum]
MWPQQATRDRRPGCVGWDIGHCRSHGRFYNRNSSDKKEKRKWNCCIHRGGSKTGAAYVDSCESISSQTLSLDRDSSSESNFETVWPVGSIDKASPRFGSLSNTDNRNANMIGECYSTGGDRKILGKGVLLEEAIWQRHQMAHLPKSGTWVLFVGIALLLLLPLLLSILPDSTMNTFNATCTDAFTVP